MGAHETHSVSGGRRGDLGRTRRKFDFHTAADVDDRPVQELELGNVDVGPVALVPATARGVALAGELAHLNAQRFFAQIAFDELSTK